MTVQKYYKVQEVASLLQVPDFQVYELAHMGELQAFKVGKHWRIPESGLETYIERQTKLYNLK